MSNGAIKAAKESIRSAILIVRIAASEKNTAFNKKKAQEDIERAKDFLSREGHKDLVKIAKDADSLLDAGKTEEAAKVLIKLNNKIETL